MSTQPHPLLLTSNPGAGPCTAAHTTSGCGPRPLAVAPPTGLGPASTLSAGPVYAPGPDPESTPGPSTATWGEATSFLLQWLNLADSPNLRAPPRHDRGRKRKCVTWCAAVFCLAVARLEEGVALVVVSCSVSLVRPALRECSGMYGAR